MTSIISKNLLPALGVGGIEVAGLAAGNSRAAPAERQQLALGALFKLCVVAVLLHLADPHIGQSGLKDIARLADVLGHSSIETTRIYLAVSGAEQARQLDKLRLVS